MQIIHDHSYITQAEREFISRGYGNMQQAVSEYRDYLDMCAKLRQRRMERLCRRQRPAPHQAHGADRQPPGAKFQDLPVRRG